MTTILATIAAIGAYFLTMAILAFLTASLGASGGAFGMLNVQPYRGLRKWTVIALSALAGVSVFRVIQQSRAI